MGPLLTINRKLNSVDFDSSFMSNSGSPAPPTRIAENVDKLSEHITFKMTSDDDNVVEKMVFDDFMLKSPSLRPPVEGMEQEQMEEDEEEIVDETLRKIAEAVAFSA